MKTNKKNFLNFREKQHKTNLNILKYAYGITICFAIILPYTLFSQTQDCEQTKHIIKEKLNIPFGTLIKLNVEIIDGKELDKAHTSHYLLKIHKIDTLNLEKPIVIEFKDESGHFPENVFSLYELLYKKKATAELSSKVTEKINSKYIGKRYDVIGYETGGFIGTPSINKYSGNLPSFDFLISQDYSFHFNNYIVIFEDLSDNK